MAVMGESEVDQHRFAVRAKYDVSRLQIEVNDVLPVKLIERHRDREAETCDFLRRHRSAIEPVVESNAVDVLHDEIRRGLDVSVGDERRMMGSLCERAEHCPADLESDDVHCTLARTEPRYLHDERQRTVGTGEPEDRCHAAGVDHLAQTEAIDRAARLWRVHQVPRCRRSATRSGSPAARILRTVGPKS